MSILNILNSSARCAAVCLALIGALPAAQPAGAATSIGKPLPAESLYWLSVPLTDAQGKRFELRDLAGHPVLVRLFYGDCNTACPIVLENLQQTIAALKPAAGKLSVLMVSLDPLRDTPASLARLGQSHHLDNTIFRLAVSTDETHTRTMAAALNIKYRVLGGGEINHSTRIFLIDADGKVVASSAQLSAVPDQKFLTQIQQELK
jgi:protein SCO1